jgi:putative redox protein
MATASAHLGKQHYQTKLNNGRHQLIADEPVEMNGTDLGFSPQELLCSSLAACTCITLRVYADRKEMKLSDVKVNVDFERDVNNNISNIKREIELFGELSDDDRKRLFSIANMCFIHKTLTNPINVLTELK